MDPLQLMGAVRMRVQTADKYITIIHNKTQLINILWSKKLSVYSKYIKAFNFKL